MRKKLEHQEKIAIRHNLIITLSSSSLSMNSCLSRLFGTPAESHFNFLINIILNDTYKHEI